MNHSPVLWVLPAPQRCAKASEELISKKNAAGQVGHGRLLEENNGRRSPPAQPSSKNGVRLLFCTPRAPCSAHLNLLLVLQPTETERCIESLLAVFQRYAGREGDNCTLSKREFLAFMNTELAAFTKVRKIQTQRASRSVCFSPRDGD